MTKIRVNATCRKCSHKVHRMEMKTAISCTILFFFSSRRRHTMSKRDWSSDVCSSDLIDHNVLNPEIGTVEDFDAFVGALRAHGMGQILDVVPNHMGVMGADNAWWLDVLENGQASTYAEFFDIDWEPLKDELQFKVLVPVLGDQYGTVLDRGEFKLKFDAEKGEFSIFYYQHRFPIDPKEYPRILAHRIERLERTLGAQDPQLLELQSLIAAFNHLPG